MNPIVLFDGDCHFCDYSVQFIIKRDPKAIFTFASLQSEVGRKIQSRFHVPQHIDSLLLITQDHVYYKSSAALHICKHLSGLWKLLYILILIPSPLRNWAYDLIAKNRYRWFGKKMQCNIPTPDERSRFL